MIESVIRKKIDRIETIIKTIIVVVMVSLRVGQTLVALLGRKEYEMGCYL